MTLPSVYGLTFAALGDILEQKFRCYLRYVKPSLARRMGVVEEGIIGERIRGVGAGQRQGRQRA